MDPNQQTQPIQNETTVAQPNLQQPMVNKVSSSKSKWKLILFIIVLLIIVLGGAIYYLTIKQNEQTTENKLATWNQQIEQDKLGKQNQLATHNISNVPIKAVENDAKRTSNVHAILNAVHQYMSDHEDALPTGITTTVKNISNTDANICAALVPAYIPALPSDPQINKGTDIINCTEAYDTGYTIVLNNNKITVSAQTFELNIPISVTR